MPSSGIDAYLSACQFITLCSIGLGLAGEPAVAELLGPVLEPLGEFAGVGSAAISFAIAYALVSVLHVVVGELAPGNLAIARTRPTGLAFAPPMRLFYLATKPIVDLLNWLGNLVLRPFGIPGQQPATPPARTNCASWSAEPPGGHDRPAEHEFTDNVFAFGDRRGPGGNGARAAGGAGLPSTRASPRPSIRSTGPTAATPGSRYARPTAASTPPWGSSTPRTCCVPPAGTAKASLRDLARPLCRVPDGVLLDELLESLRRDRQHLALVVDEHDKAVGIITLEDVLEEIVGEIEDEFDTETDEVRVGEPRVPADGKETG